MATPPKAQLRWQCRRGMRELDQLLARYLEHRYDAADAAERGAFSELLTLSDPELISYLLSNERPPAEIADVISRILDCPRA